jgi:hypothetical protein
MATRPLQAFLFYGPAGTGKTTAARILAVSFQCPHQKEFGAPCEDCWKQESEFAIHEINASEVNGVEEIGKVAEMGRYRPAPPSRKRVIILDEVQRCTSAAQNLMLKPLEDAPKSTVWILCTTEPSKLLPTLRRRCMAYQMKPLPLASRELLLQRAAKKIEFTKPLDPLIEQVHTMQISSPALLLMALEKYASGLSAQEAVAGTDSPGVDSLRICRAVSDGKWETLKKLLQEASPEEARWIRASVSGWVRGCLVRESLPKRQAMLAECLVDLSAMAPLEDAQLMFWLWGVLYKVCRRFRVG